MWSRSANLASLLSADHEVSGTCTHKSACSNSSGYPAKSSHASPSIGPKARSRVGRQFAGCVRVPGENRSRGVRSLNSAQDSSSATRRSDGKKLGGAGSRVERGRDHSTIPDERDVSKAVRDLLGLSQSDGRESQVETARHEARFVPIAMSGYPGRRDKVTGKRAAREAVETYRSVFPWRTRQSSTIEGLFRQCRSVDIMDQSSLRSDERP